MIKKVFSDYADRKNARKGRRFVVLLIDFFTTVIFSFLIFGVLSYPVLSNLSFVEEYSTNATKQGEELYLLVGSTRLQTYDKESSSLVKVEKDGKNYITSLLKTSFFKSGEDYYELVDNKKVKKEISESDTFLSSKDNDSPKDNLSYYFLSFSSENGIHEVRTRKDFNSSILKLDGDNKDLVTADFDISQDVFYLNSQNSNDLISYLNYGETGKSGETLYNRLLDIYASGVNVGIKEVETSYQPYKDALALLQQYSGSYARCFDVAFILSYLLGFLIVYLVFPLCFKNGKTIGYKFFSMALVRNDLDKPRFVNYLIKYLVLFVAEFCGVFFLPLFLGRLNLMSFSLVGSVTMFQLLFFSLMIALVSLVFFFVSKDNQTLSEFASLTYTVDITEHEDRLEEGKTIFGE